MTGAHIVVCVRYKVLRAQKTAPSHQIVWQNYDFVSLASRRCIQHLKKAVH
jgi:hypothetical protein